MWGERRCALVLALALLPAAAAAENLLKFELFGLHLGDSSAVVQARYPGVFVSKVPYIDPEVGTRYEASLGRLAVERLEGLGTIQAPVGGPSINLRVALTGNDRLYDLQATQQFGAPVDCKARMRELRATYGDPDVQVAQEQIQWIERRDGADRFLEVRCFREGRLSWRLADQRALADYIADLRADLAPYIEQARTVPP